jgi:hypothetical protein
MATKNYPALTLEELLEKELYESFQNYDNYELINSENREFKYQLDSEVDEVPLRPRIYPVISDQNGEPYVFRNAETDELFIKDDDGKLIPYGDKDPNMLSVNTKSTNNEIDLTAIESVKQKLIKVDDYPKVIYQETNYQIKAPPVPPPESPKSQLINIKFGKIVEKLVLLLNEAGFNKKTQQKVISQLDNNIERSKKLVEKIEFLKGIKSIEKKLDNKIDTIEDESDESNIKIFKFSIPKKTFKITIIVILVILIIFFIKRFILRYHKQARMYRYIDRKSKY